MRHPLFHGNNFASAELPHNGSAVLLNNMELCVHYFSRALRYGAKYVYQALPRLVTIWLDMGAWPDLATLPVEILTPGKDANAAGTSTAKYVSTSDRMAILTVIVDRARKIEQQKSGLSSTVKSAISTFEKINGHIRRSLEKIPAYMVRESFIDISLTIG